MDKTVKEILPYAIGGLVLYFLIKDLGSEIKKVLPGTENPASTDKINKELSKGSASPWDPAFWKNYSGQQTLLGTDTAYIYIQALLNSVGWISDDFSQALGIFKQLKTQSQVSYLADQFFKSEGEDLLTWLQGTIYPNDHFSDEQVATIIDYVSKLPKYML